VTSLRLCRHQGCGARAKATLTFAYAQRTAVLGPLAPARSAEGIDLCPAHCDHLSVPRGWDIVRLPLDEPGTPAPSPQDLRALADAVRAAAGLTATPAPAPRPLPANIVTLAERRHLRVVTDAANSQARRVG
jgi:hypothetical protein